MIPAPIPPDEEARLQALRELLILDTPPEERFDRITRFAMSEFEVPIATISLVDRDRQWFKSNFGLDACEASRDVSFCGHTILERRFLVVPDALKDERFRDNPLVSGPPWIRFYAGAILRLPFGRIVLPFATGDVGYVLDDDNGGLMWRAGGGLDIKNGRHSSLLLLGGQETAGGMAGWYARAGLLLEF